MIALLNSHQPQYYSGTSLGNKSDNAHPEVNTAFSTSTADYLERDHVCLSFRGSLFNNAHLTEILELSPQKTDLELVVLIYLKYGIEQTLRLLVGDYSFLLLDINIKHQHSILYVVQNPMGSVPLYRFTATTNRGAVYAFSGTLASKPVIPLIIEPLLKTEYIQGGTYQTYHLSIGVSPKWCLYSTNKYFTLPLYSNSLFTSLANETQIAHQLYTILNDIILSMCMTYSGEGKRLAVIDGGDIGSRIIGEMVKQVCDVNRLPPPQIFALQIHKHDTDVPNYIRDGRNYVNVKNEVLCRHMRNIVECAESTHYDAIVQSVAPYFISKHIKTHYPDINCVFHGVGCDELFGNTELYSHSANPVKYDMDMCISIEKLMNFSVKSIHRTLATDRITLCAPFIQQSLVCYVMNICPFTRKCLLNTGDMFLLHEVANILNANINVSKSCDTNYALIRKTVSKCADGDVDTYLKDMFHEIYGTGDVVSLQSNNAVSYC